MPFVSLGIPSHDVLPGVSTADHHTQTVAPDLNLADLAERLHASLATVTVDQHHTEAHTAAHDLGGADSLATAPQFALSRLWSH